MDLGLEGKVALVLGAAGGLGGAIATSLAAEGAHIALADIDATALRGAEVGISQSGSQALAVPFDLADHAAMNACVAAVEAAFGEIDVLVNITGGPPATPAAGPGSGKVGRELRDDGALCYCADRQGPAGHAQAKMGKDHHVDVFRRRVAYPQSCNLDALRLSLVGWSKTLAREVGRDGVTANIVVPGRIATKRVNYLDGQKAKRENRSVQEVAAESASSIPVGRYGEPVEYADVITFLASARASYINGSTIRVDGGLITSI